MTESIISGFLMGGLGVAIVNAVAKGLQRRASAKGRRFSALDAAITARHNWKTDDLRVREMAASGGVHDLPDLPPDPYADLMSKEPTP